MSELGELLIQAAPAYARLYDRLGVLRVHCDDLVHGSKRELDRRSSGGRRFCLAGREASVGRRRIATGGREELALERGLASDRDEGDSMLDGNVDHLDDTGSALSVHDDGRERRRRE